MTWHSDAMNAPHAPAHETIAQAIEEAQAQITDATRLIVALGLIDKGFHDGIVQGYLMAANASLEAASAALNDFLDKTPAELRARIETGQREVLAQIEAELRETSGKPR